MHVSGTLYGDLNAARSRPKDIIKRFIFLILYVIDPPKSKGQHPVMSPALEKALSEIEKGTEERLEVLRHRKKQVEEGESFAEPVPKIMGHIEKVEEEEIEDEQEGDKAVAAEEVGGGQMANRGGPAAEEAGGEQTTGKDTEGIDETAKQMDKDEQKNETEGSNKKPQSTLSITRLKEEWRRALAREQE